MGLNGKWDRMAAPNFFQDKVKKTHEAIGWFELHRTIAVILIKLYFIH